MAVSISSVTSLAAATSRAVADQPEAGDIGAGVDRIRRQSRSASLAARFSRTIDATAAATGASGARPALIAVAMMPVPSAFVSSSTSPGRAPALVQMRSRMNLAGHRVAELDLLVLNGVAAKQLTPALLQRVEAAGKDARHDRDVQSLGNAAIASAVSGRPPIA